MADVRERVLARIESLRDEAVALLVEMVAVDSTTPGFPGTDPERIAGGETRVNEVLAPRYAQAGLDVAWVEAEPGRRNLVGVRRGAGGGRSLALNGHVDTVAPVDPEGWRIPTPWTAEVHDGRLYGLGTTDMKGSGAAMWAVAQALEAEGVRLAGDLQLHSVCGEELCGHELGTTAVIRAGYRTDGAIVTEPTSYPRPLTVSTVAPSVLLLRIEVEGVATHAGNRPLVIRPGGAGAAIGVNALEKIAKVLAALQELEQEWGLSKAHPGFGPGFFTIGPNLLHADAGLPFPAYLPDRAVLEYVIWHPPQEAPEAVQAEATRRGLLVEQRTDAYYLVDRAGRERARMLAVDAES